MLPWPAETFFEPDVIDSEQILKMLTVSNITECSMINMHLWMKIS